MDAIPGRDPALGQRLQAARDQLRRSETAAALASVDAILAEHPGNVNAQRLRQDILRQRGRFGLALHESELRLEREPRNALSHYLRGRLLGTTAAKRAAFERAIEIDPEHFWGWYGLAFTLRDANNHRANAIYRQLYEKSRHEHGVGTALALSLRRGGHNDESSRVYRELWQAHPGIGAVGLAETLLRSGRHKQAWPIVLEALRRRPFDPAVHALVGGLLGRGLPEDGIQELLDVLRADPGRMRQFAKRGAGLLAELFRRAGEPETALELLRASPRTRAAERRVYRRLLIHCEGVPAFLRDVTAGIPRWLVEDEGNQVRDRWRALLSGPWMTATDPLATPATSLALTLALRDVGFLEFADVVASRALLRHGAEGSGLLELRCELRREIAFESGLRRFLTRGYVDFGRRGEAVSIEEAFEAIRALSRETLGEDVVGEPKEFELPFVGTLIDALGPGLPAHLAKYDKHLVMGQRNGRPTEGMILTCLSKRLVDPVDAVPLPPRTIEVVGEHRQLEPFEMADLAGIALLNHYVIDMDEVRLWAATIARRRRIAREDDDVLLRDPLPEKVDASVPAGVEWRLSVLSTVQDDDLEAAVLDVIRWHERGHMVDFLYLLPVEWHPIRALALTARNGFDALSIAAEMEARAELTALAMSPHTRLVAAHLAGFLDGDSGESPHARGFRELVEEILDELRRRGVTENAVRSWHRVDPHVLRDVGRHLLQRLW